MIHDHNEEHNFYSLAYCYHVPSRTSLCGLPLSKMVNMHGHVRFYIFIVGENASSALLLQSRRGLRLRLRLCAGFLRDLTYVGVDRALVWKITNERNQP